MRVALLCGLPPGADGGGQDNPDLAAWLACADALRDAGLRLLATSALGAALARAGRIVEPIEMFTRDPAVAGGRFELAHLRIVAGLAADVRQPRDVDALRARGVGEIACVVCRLPQRATDLAREPRPDGDVLQALRGGPWQLTAMVLELALVQGAEVFATHEVRRVPDLLLAQRKGTLGPAERQEVVLAAWRHLQGFRGLLGRAAGVQPFETAVRLAASSGAIDDGRAVGGDLAPRTRHSSGGVLLARQPAEAAPVALGPGAVAPDVVLSPPSTPLAAVGAAAGSLVAAGPADGHAETAATALPAPLVATAQIWPELPTSGRTRVALPPGLRPGLRIADDDAEGLDAGVLASLGAAVELLEALAEPAVVIAYRGLPCVVVRRVSTAVRALLRAVALDPLALQGGVLATTLALDVTSARALGEGAAARLAIIAALEIDEDARGTLSQAPGRALLQLTAGEAATHRLLRDGQEAFIEPRPTLPGAAELLVALRRAYPAVDEVVGAALRLGLATLRALPGVAAVAAHPEMALGICGGQAHASDALQVVIAKSRKPPAGSVLVCNAVPADLRVFAPWLAAGGGPICLVDLPSVPPELAAAQSPVVALSRAMLAAMSPERAAI